MGVRLLNSFLSSIESNGMKEVHLSDLHGKKIVIDASIYLYRFKFGNSLIEKMYLMCSILRYYCVHAIFVFDGSCDPDKTQTLLARQKDKRKAGAQYRALQSRLSCEDVPKSQQKKIKQRLNALGKRMVRVTFEDREAVIQLLDAYGMCHMTAKGEADTVCCSLVRQGYAFACMSEDTDMFAYGCPRVLKYLSLMKHTVVMYTLDDILEDLKMSSKEFRVFCAISGTDYNESSCNIFHLYELFGAYRKSTKAGFLQWLSKEGLLSVDHALLSDVIERFNLVPSSALEGCKYQTIRNKAFDPGKLEGFMGERGFLFP